MTATGELAYLDLMSPDFRPATPTCTPPALRTRAPAPRLGLAVLRRDKPTELLSDRRLVQDCHNDCV